MHRAILFILAGLTAGCDDPPDPSTEPTESTTQTPGQPHDCEPYESEPIETEDPGAWTAPNTVIQKSISIPDDGGGGYVTYRAYAHKGAEPAFVVTHGEEGGVITGGSSAGTSSPHTRVGGFAVAPGETYDVWISDFFNCTDYEPECRVDFTWTYHPRMDCYEPNDTRDAARRVPTDALVQAWMIGGHLGNYYVADPLEDWYAFTLDEAADVTLALTLGPGDARMWYQVFNEDDAVVFGNSGSFLGEYPIASSGVLQAGRYDVLVGAVGTSGSWSQEAPMADAFRHRYTMRIDTVPDDDPTCELTPSSLEPMSISGMFEGPAGVVTHEQRWSFEGSGYVEVTAGGGFAARVVVEADGTGIATGTAGEGAVTVFHEAQPGVDYTYRVEQQAEAEAYPVQAVGEVTLLTRGDCHEPNDTWAEAREIADNRPVQAFFLAGHGASAPEASDYDDWYAVDLRVASTVSLDVLDLPASVATSVRLLDAEGTTLQAIEAASVGRVRWGELAPGRYLVGFEPSATPPGPAGTFVAPGAGPPPHFDQPYAFRVNASPAEE